MKRQVLFLTLTVMLLGLLQGCATTTFQYREPTYTQAIEKGTVFRQFSLEPGLEERILALNPEQITERDIQDVLSKAPAPRVINIHGGIYPVHLCMVSFSEFLIGMGYPESRIRSPGSGSLSFSCYESSEKMAGAIAW